MKKFLLKKNTSQRVSPDGETTIMNDSMELVQLEQEKFYMVYTKYIQWIYGIRSGKTLALLFKLLDMMEYDTGIIDLSPSQRQLIMMELDMSPSSLTQALGKLLEKEAIYKRTMVNPNTGEIIELKGNYVINPIMFWKGRNKERVSLKVKFEPVQEINVDKLKEEGFELIEMHDHEEEESND